MSSLVVLSVLLLAQSDPAAAAPVADDVTSAFRLDLQYARVNGHVQVRELGLHGTRLQLHELGIDDAEVAALEFDQRVSDRSRLRLRARWYFASGSASFPTEIEFNGVRYAADSTLHSKAELGDLLFLWERDLVRFGAGGRVAFLGGFDYTYLNFRIDGPVAADSSSQDTAENFWRQSLPLPALGVRVDWPVAPSASLYLEGWGFRALRWNSLRSEGGTVYLTQTFVDSALGWSWRMSRSTELDLGLRFDYLWIDEESHEDGNHFLLRDLGPFVAWSVRF